VKRVERRRTERRQRLLLTVGLSFAIGALTAAGLTWRQDMREPSPSPVSATEAEIAALEAVTRAPTSPERARPLGLREEGGGRQPVAVATSGTAAAKAAIELLRDRDLKIPVEDVDRDDLRDSYQDARGTRVHEAIDIMAPRGTPVRAVEDGRLVKLFNSKQGGLTIYMFEPSETFCYYYAHLDGYAAGIKEGQEIRRGQVIGYVGSTGNASEDAPHLHFSIFRLTAERQWSKGEPLNPYEVFK
jgi:peptidoglycan LD-endopeptidase LytH